jgi:hypothetical protein
MPAPGHVLLGVTNEKIDLMNKVTGRRHQLVQMFLPWRHPPEAIERYLKTAKLKGTTPVIHISTANGRDKSGDKIERHSPRDIATGRGDQWLLSISRIANDSRRTAWIRPMSEMNGSWNVYSAFNEDGSPRDAAHRSEHYVQAFRRITLIMRGGKVATINRKLRELGLPPLKVKATELPQSGKIAMIWNPHGQGSPRVTGNLPENYWPGSDYVDYVSNDIFSKGNNDAWWSGMDYTYDRFDKPFVIGEWGSFGVDDGEFVENVFEWAKEHPRTKAMIWFDGREVKQRRPSSHAPTIQLRKSPESLKAYRDAVREKRFAPSG